MAQDWIKKIDGVVNDTITAKSANNRVCDGSESYRNEVPDMVVQEEINLEKSGFYWSEEC